MTIEDRPLVSVVTPVYNGAEYLVECMESVIKQTYPNWEYVVVNNCSTDGTLEIAEGYAKRDARIRIVNNRDFVDAITNHNIALRAMLPASTYCKVLQADDWLFPEFLEETVGVAVRNPRCGIIGAYVLWGHDVRSDGIPYATTVMSGAETCRLTLLGEIYPFVNLSGLLLRADVVRKRDPFMQEASLHADVATYYQLLQECDFGFVHQVLSFVRMHEGSRSAKLADKLNTYRFADLDLLVRFGPTFLSEQELKVRLNELLRGYYRFLASPKIKPDAEFWQFHRNALVSLGYPLDMKKLWLTRAVAMANKVTNKLQNLVRFA